MKKEKQKKEKKSINFTLIWHYLKDDKIKIILYIVLLVLSMLPAIITAYIWGNALENLLNHNVESFVLYTIIYSSSLISIYALLDLPVGLLYNYLEAKFMKNVSKDLYKKINDLPAKAFEEMGVGELMNRLTGDTASVIDLLSSMIKMLCKMFIAIAIFIYCFFISWVLVLEIVAMIIVMGILANYFFPKIQKSQKEIKEQTDDYSRLATENITGIREIKALGIKRKTERTVDEFLDELSANTRKINDRQVIYFSLNNGLYFLLQFLVFITCGHLYLEGKIAYSLFVIVENALYRIDDVIESLSSFGLNYNKIVVSLERISDLLNDKLYLPEKFGTAELTNAKGRIEFKNVDFKYSNDEQNTLNGFNMTIEPHKKVAIVGRSGNGKSTIFNLLLRYFDATQGEILIDGVNICDLTEESLRKNISIIRQSPFIFNMSIKENFELVKEGVTLEEIRDVCKRAYLDEYIMSLPKQYDTIIGEGGINLSGGQKQRLAIARTLLCNTKIILFDEATSALDNESQDYIKKTIDTLIVDHTVVIVAHRLSTIKDADIINVIDKGTLAGSGTHEELMKSNNIYRRLYESEEEKTMI